MTDRDIARLVNASCMDWLSQVLLWVCLDNSKRIPGLADLAQDMQDGWALEAYGLESRG